MAGKMIFQTMKSSEKKPRLRATKRASLQALPGFRLTQRDREIIKAVYAHRALTTLQIARFFFPPSPKRGINSWGQYRLQLLYQYRYLYRVEQAQKLSEGRKPLVYFLDVNGAQVVADILGLAPEELDWRPGENDVSPLFLDHLIATNDVRIAISLAAQKQGWKVAKWIDEKTLKSSQMKDVVEITGPQGRKQRAAVVPDGYFLLHAGEYVYHHFVEVDRRTVTGEASLWGRRDWARKVRAYLAYFRSGKYQDRYQAKGLRILTVTTGERRLANLKTVTEKVGGKKMFWFTTFDKVTPETVLTDPIWQMASEEGFHSLTW